MALVLEARVTPPSDDAIVVPAIDPDRPWVERFRAGDRAAFEDLVRRHQQAIWRLCRRYVRNDADAADLTQQAFVRAFQGLGRFRGAATFRSWLYRIAINLALNHLRDAREVPSEIDAEALAVGATGAARLIAEEDATRLRAAIQELPPKQRMVLELRVFDDLSFREVAELADCTENAAKVSFHYAVKRLRELLGEPTAPAADAAAVARPEVRR